jgi:hypothetical protein
MRDQDRIKVVCKTPQKKQRGYKHERKAWIIWFGGLFLHLHFSINLNLCIPSLLRLTDKTWSMQLRKYLLPGTATRQQV